MESNILDNLVTKKVGRMLISYDPTNRLFLDHVDGIWRQYFVASVSERPKYKSVRDWNQTRLANYVSALLEANKAIASGDLESFKNTITNKKVIQEIQRIIDTSLQDPKTAVEKAKALLDPEAKAKPVVEKQPRVIDEKYKGMSKFERQYYELVDSLDVPNKAEFCNVRARLPIGLSDKMIMDALVKYQAKTDYKSFKLDVDFAKAIISTIVVSYSQYILAVKRRTWESKYHEKPGFVQCSNELLRATSTNNYKHYALALEEAGIIECDYIYMNFPDNKKAYSYKINEKYFHVPDSTRRHRVDFYKNYHIKFMMLRFKVRYRDKKRNQMEQLHVNMADDAEIVLGKVDTNEMIQACETNPLEFYDVKTEQELIDKLSKPDTMTAEHLAEVIDGIKERGIYVNPCDSFGGRFHTPFTNLKSAIRGHIKYDGSRYINVDIKNSQMVILATIMDHPEIAKKLLSEFKLGLTPELASKIDEVELLKNLNDVKDFCNKTKNGQIYEYISEYLEVDRHTAKIQLLSILFSNEDQFRQIKYYVGKKYPSLIKLSNKLNDVEGVHYLPMLCQRFESALFINTIVREFYNSKKYPAVTIHDSIMVHPDDYELFMNVYNNEFKKLGITPFQTSVERY